MPYASGLQDVRKGVCRQVEQDIVFSGAIARCETVGRKIHHTTPDDCGVHLLQTERVSVPKGRPASRLRPSSLRAFRKQRGHHSILAPRSLLKLAPSSFWRIVIDNRNNRKRPWGCGIFGYLLPSVVSVLCALCRNLAKLRVIPPFSLRSRGLKHW